MFSGYITVPRSTATRSFVLSSSTSEAIKRHWRSTNNSCGDRQYWSRRSWKRLVSWGAILERINSSNFWWSFKREIHDMDFIAVYSFSKQYLYQNASTVQGYIPQVPGVSFYSLYSPDVSDFSYGKKVVTGGNACFPALTKYNAPTLVRSMYICNNFTNYVMHIDNYHKETDLIIML